jgi:hypothetical protein
MPGADWIIRINDTSYEYLVLNATFDNGRRSFLDDWAVNYATVTLRNNLGQFNSLVRGNEVAFYNGITGARFPFWLDQITFNDEIEDDACTVTLVCSDVIGRLGKTLAAPYNIAFGAAFDMEYLRQSFELAVDENNLKAPPTFTLPTGSLTQHQQYNLPDGVKYPLSEIVNVVLKNIQGGFYVYQLAYPNWAFVPVTPDMILRNVPAYTFGESATSTKIVWDQCNRDNYGDLFANSVTLAYFNTGFGNSDPYRNTTSINSVGVQSMTFDSYNNTYHSGNPFTPGLGKPDPFPDKALGDWYATVLADPNLQTFRVRFSNFAQNATAMGLFEASLERLSTSMNTLTYKKPGTGLVTERVRVEGFTVSIEPEVTYYDVYMSPIAIYSQLVLNQTEQGKLDTYRLGF